MPKASVFYEGDVPFDAQGNMQEFAGAWSPAVAMHPVTPFYGDMKVLRWTKGRSSVRVYVRDTQSGVKYPMFMADFWTVLMKHGLNNETIHGVKWVACKKGANYGLKEYEG
jgi:hypothetical protein